MTTHHGNSRTRARSVISSPVHRPPVVLAPKRFYIMPQAETATAATNATARQYAGGGATPPVEPLPGAASSPVSTSHTPMSKEQPAAPKKQSEWHDEVGILVQGNGMCVCVRAQIEDSTLVTSAIRLILIFRLPSDNQRAEASAKPHIIHQPLPKR